MMHKNSIDSLFTDADEDTIREISEKVSDPFDADSIFRSSYAKFMGEKIPQKTVCPIYKRKTFRVWTAAACLLMTVGLSIGVWSKQQRIEIRPPQETKTTAVTPTEKRTETTTQTVTESQTETSVKASDSAIYTTQVSSVSQQAVSETALQTTEPKPQIAVSTALQTKPAEVSTEPIITVVSDATLPHMITVTQTSLTAHLQTRSVFPSETSSICSDVPSDTTAEMTSAVSGTDTAETYFTTVQELRFLSKSKLPWLMIKRVNGVIYEDSEPLAYGMEVTSEQLEKLRVYLAEHYPEFELKECVYSDDMPKNAAAFYIQTNPELSKAERMKISYEISENVGVFGGACFPEMTEAPELSEQTETKAVPLESDADSTVSTNETGGDLL
jgi:hypothetical protein